MMNRITRRLGASFLLAGAFFVSCSKGHDSSTPPATDSNWKMGNYTYTRSASSQTANGNLKAIAVSTSGNGGNYGAYSGSALTFTFYSNLGPGKYSPATVEDLVKNPATKLIKIDCVVGSAVNTGSVMYSLAESSAIVTDVTADVTVDGNGQYHISLSKPLTLTKTIIVGNGIPDAPNTAQLTINNAY